jgi:hypothetical protein
MWKIAERYGEISHSPAPGLEVLIDYFVNMVYGLELLLKVLARDWDVPGKSKYRHKVGEMYEAVFGRQHVDPLFMRELEDAILDQKFLCEPAKGLVDRVEAIENLWDELVMEYSRNGWDKRYQVIKEVKTAPPFACYLMNNLSRFAPPPTHQSDPMTTSEKIAMHRAHIQHLQDEINRLEREGEPVFDIDAILAQLTQRQGEQLRRISLTMKFQFEMWGMSELEFAIHRMGMRWAALRAP